MSRQTTAHVRGQGGSELVVQHSHSDAPLLPIQGVERLHAFRPDRVDWVFEQTEVEAQSRRNEEVRVNTFIFVERMAGVVSALLVGCLGVSGGIYVALRGHDWLGGVIAVTTIGSLAVAFLARGKGDSVPTR